MSSSENKIPLGAVLQQAGLVTADLVQEALQQQRQANNQLRIGEILAARGYIKPQTATFFAEQWFEVVKSEPKQPIGQYLKQAALLDEQQIQSILNQQQQSQLKFGELAIACGWLKPVTLDFFLRYLYPQALRATQPDLKNNSKVRSDLQIHQDFYKIKLRLLDLEDREAYSEPVLDRILFWTGGQSWLTKKLSQLIADQHSKLIDGKEVEAVDYLVQTKLLQSWREGALGKHLEAIEGRLLDNLQVEPQKLLRLYREIITTKVSPDQSLAQQELLKMGLVVKQQDRLVVANRIYQLVFNPSWLNEHLDRFQDPQGSAVALVKSDRDWIVAKPPPAKPLSFRFKNLLLLLALGTLLLALIRNAIKRIQVNTAFRQGNEFLKEQNYEQAILEYNALLKVDSNYFEAWTNRGYALAGMQKYQEMRESCATATVINPDAVYAWNCQGEALHNLQQPEAAIEAFDQAVAINNQDPIFLINKSESLKVLGQEAESLMVIEEAIAILENIEGEQGRDNIQGEFAVALTFLGNGYRKQQKYEPALINYNRALEYSPNYFPAQIGKGIVLHQAQRYSEAQDEFETILQNQELSPAKQAQTWFYLGKTLCSSQQPESGITAFERAIKLKPDYQAAQQARQSCL